MLDRLQVRTIFAYGSDEAASLILRIAVPSAKETQRTREGCNVGPLCEGRLPLLLRLSDRVTTVKDCVVRDHPAD
jgi:hypothetical protein